MAEQGEYAAALNTVLHKLLGVWTPCQHACTHIVYGEWTCLGAANVLARHRAADFASSGQPDD